MALDREDTLKKAEKLLKQGRVDGAIAEYVRLVDDQPRDWGTANTLGDLYVRAGQAEKAAAQYCRIADHFAEDGFYPKAAALYRKVLKISPNDEVTQLKLAELSVRQGLLADARAHFNAVLGRRRARGDRAGLDDILIRLGTIDPNDFDARRTAARVLAGRGDAAGAAGMFRALYEDLTERDRPDEALGALRDAVAAEPGNSQLRATLANVLLASGDLDGARQYLDRATAASDPKLLIVMSGNLLRDGNLDGARELLAGAAQAGGDVHRAILDLGWSLSSSHPEATYICADLVADAQAAAGDYPGAAQSLQAFIARMPERIPALLKLVEVSVDGGLESTMYEAQAQLADAYLSAGKAAEARVIAEDLVAREPWESEHIERFRRALVMLRVPEPDTLIAERLSGQSPFTATDLFAEPVPGPVGVAASGATGPIPDEAPTPPEERPAPPPPPAAPPPAPRPPEKGVEAGDIDLTGALDLQGGQLQGAPPSLEDVFRRLRGATSGASGDDEAEQYLARARSSIDAGKSEEALTALRIAARSPRQRFVAAGMLGHLYLEQGDLMHAVEWLERAAEAPAPGAEEKHALLYELGTVLELLGETARALAVFLELQTEEQGYRDVAERVTSLARVQAGG